MRKHSRNSPKSSGPRRPVVSTALAALAPLVAVALGPWVACTEGEAPVACRVGADCMSGQCRPDGTCSTQPVEGLHATTDGGSDAGTEPGTPGPAQPDLGGASADGGPATNDGGAGSAPGDGGTGIAVGLAACAANGDGVVSGDELLVAPRLHAHYTVSGPVAFSPAGAVLPDGGHLWDFTQALEGDTRQRAETLPVEGAWYGEHFPGASYASALGESTGLLGVFQKTPTALLMLGAVSPQPAYTLIRYTPPVVVLQLPLKLGDSWSTAGMVSGQYQGQTISHGLTWGSLPYQTDTYSAKVDLAGEAVTPYARFRVLRVATVMRRSRALWPVPSETLRTFTFVAECFGSVATLTSAAGESSAEPARFDEVRRLAP